MVRALLALYPKDCYGGYTGLVRCLKMDYCICFLFVLFFSFCFLFCFSVCAYCTMHTKSVSSVTTGSLTSEFEAWRLKHLSLTMRFAVCQSFFFLLFSGVKVAHYAGNHLHKQVVTQAAYCKFTLRLKYCQPIPYM